MPGKEWIKGLIFRDLKTIGCYGVWEIDRLRAIRGYRQLGNGVSPFSDVLISIYAGELERVAFSSKPQNFLRTHDQSLSWTTSEAEPYSTAQMDLQAEVFPILKRTLGPDFQRSCAEFLRHWCAEYFFSILERGRLSQWTEIGPYVSWISSVCGVLSVRQRLKLYFQVGFYFFRLIKRSSISRLRRLMKPA
jgi:hypothetical protein